MLSCQEHRAMGLVRYGRDLTPLRVQSTLLATAQSGKAAGPNYQSGAVVMVPAVSNLELA